MNKQVFKIRWYAWIWEFPQTMLGLLLALYLSWKDSRIKLTPFNDSIIIRSARYKFSGVSLGGYIFLPWNNYLKKSQEHEYGHCRQSKLLGPLYLLVIGFPSLIHYQVHKSLNKGKKDSNSYYKFYTERWANKLK